MPNVTIMSLIHFLFTLHILQTFTMYSTSFTSSVLLCYSNPNTVGYSRAVQTLFLSAHQSFGVNNFPQPPPRTIYFVSMLITVKYMVSNTWTLPNYILFKLKKARTNSKS